MLSLFLVFVSGFLPVPRGTWFIGRHPQWIVAIDHAGLTLGPTSRARVVIGLAGLIALELIVIGIGVWSVPRVVRAMLRKRHDAPP